MQTDETPLGVNLSDQLGAGAEASLTPKEACLLAATISSLDAAIEAMDQQEMDAHLTDALMTASELAGVSADEVLARAARGMHG